MVLRRLIVFWLLVGHVGYAMSVLTNGHWGNDGHSVVALAQWDGAGGDGNCDHCCHASAHLIALPCAQVPAVPRFVPARRVVQDDRVASHLASPPQRPPKIPA